MTLIFSLITSLVLAVLFLVVIIFMVVSIAAITRSSGNGGLQLKRFISQVRCPETARDKLHKWYTWEFIRRTGVGRPPSVLRFFLELAISQSRYVEYCQRPRDTNPGHFETYVTVSTPEIKVLADKLIMLGQRRGYNAYDQLGNVLAFVQQNIRYTADLAPQTGQLIEYPKYPLETLVEKKGDCEDQTILAATLLARMGYDVALLILPAHVALGVAGFNDKPGSRVIYPATGLRYLYAETTGPNWLPGQVPREFQPYLASGQFEILPVVVE